MVTGLTGGAWHGNKRGPFNFESFDIKYVSSVICKMLPSSVAQISDQLTDGTNPVRRRDRVAALPKLLGGAFPLSE